MRKKLLLIDDYGLFAENYRDVLECSLPEVDIDWAANYDDAIVALNTHQYDGIFTDYNLKYSL